MTHSDDLHQLIKRLSKGERAYFKKFAYKQNRSEGDDRFYLKLFDYIDSMENFESEKITRKFSKNNPSFNLPTAKNYLSNLLMRSLREYQAQNDPQAQLKKLIIDIEILLDKGLKRQAEKLTRKAKLLAEENENYYALWRIRELTDRLIPIDKNEYQNKEAAYLYKKDLLQTISNATELAWLRKKTHLSIYAKFGGDIRTSEAKEELAKILETELLQCENKAQSFEAKYYFNSLYGYYYRAIGDNEKSLKYRTKTVELFNQQPNLKIIFKTLYLGGMFNLLLMLNLLRRFEDFDRFFSEFEEFTNEKFPRASHYQQSYLLTFNALQIEKNNLSSEYDKNIPVIKSIEEQLTFYSKQLNERKLNDFYLEIATTYFGLEKHKASLEWLNKTMNEEHHRYRYTNESKYLVVMIMRIILHYELGNFDILESLLKSTKRAIGQAANPMQFEELILDHLKQIAAFADSDEAQIKLKEFYAVILKSEDCPEMNTIGLSYFDFASWAYSKLNGVSFVEARQQSVLT